MKQCPNCGTPLMNGWCPNCHPNPKLDGLYKTHAAGQALQSFGCALMLLVLVVILCIILYACATA